jgi:tRNA (guanosine-2'-O-)-methyltransferase
MTPERYQRLIDTLNNRQPDLTVVADEVYKDRNLSAIVRTCDAVGIDQIHTVQPEESYRYFRGTASGSHKWVDVAVHADLATPITDLKARGFQVLATAVDRSCCSYLEVDYTVPTALLVGNERHGVSPDGIAAADQLITVPMVGMVESFNVSVAVAIILQEAYRQRQAAGLYGQLRLSAELAKRRFFTWAHPSVAQYCDENGLSYPEVDPDDGEIIDPSAWYRRVRIKKPDDLGETVGPRPLGVKH